MNKASYFKNNLLDINVFSCGFLKIIKEIYLYIFFISGGSLYYYEQTVMAKITIFIGVFLFITTFILLISFLIFPFVKRENAVKDFSDYSKKERGEMIGGLLIGSL
ncbi:hypothetical protein J8L98_12125 [Pseudoalteromonas sp. MMG013]|uniref:hypothetical protein n=1 Tax=Pseudoalteromonas sp. MMG013 TaxID=2822687 RepID=UPI001B396233|nr:hypothetical protein [Pseudoalteromonas sp. MMG013]MBQ4862435.1 hypothetical protein [Pseudoalteromonas sp. MMG013]